MKKIDFDMTLLNRFARSLSERHVVKVGIFASRAARTNSSVEGNPEIGAKHEFGSYAEKIPQRSFLRWPLHHKAEEIVKRVVEKNAVELMGMGKIVEVYKNLGLSCEIAIDDAFSTGGFGVWAPNAPYTVEMKGSSEPLIDTAQLRRSISSKVE